MAVEYPLESTWVLWWDGSPMATCNHIKRFWECFASYDASHIRPGQRLGLFKEGVVPNWRRPEHQGGGHMKFKARSRLASVELWKALTMRCVGELIPHSECVLGVMLEAYGGGEHSRLQLWVDGPVDPSWLTDIVSYLTAEMDPGLYFDKRGTWFMSHEEALFLGTTKPKHRRRRRAVAAAAASAGTTAARSSSESSGGDSGFSSESVPRNPSPDSSSSDFLLQSHTTSPFTERSSAYDYGQFKQ